MSYNHEEALKLFDDFCAKHANNLTDDMWVAGGAINNGGIIMRWLRDKICHYSNHRFCKCAT